MSRAIEPSFFRLRPPPTAVPPGAGWALRRGFGPMGEELGRMRAPADAADWAEKLGVGERIAARSPRSLVATEVGDAAAARLLAASHRTAARNLALRELAARAVAAAAERGIEVVLLKGMALLDQIPDLDMARPLADVDLLVEPVAATELALALEAAGWSRSAVHESAHHLRALNHPDLGILEIHLYLPGVAAAGADAVTATALAAAGLVRPANELGPARVPVRRILAAHAIAHALVQNAHAPRGYPLLRLVADLTDLAAGREPVERLIDRAAPWLVAGVSTRELAGVAELCGALTAGDRPAAGSDAARILDHVVAAHLDPAYLRALELRALAAAVGRRDWLKIRRRAARPANFSRLFRVIWSRLMRRKRRKRHGGAAETH